MAVQVTLDAGAHTGSLVALASKLRNLEPLFKAIADFAVSTVTLQFHQGLDPYTAPWAALSPETVARKGSTSPLVDTGHMMGSISGIGDATSAFVGVGVEYAVHHQYGTADIPQRQILPDADNLPADWRAEIDGTIADFFASDL